MCTRSQRRLQNNVLCAADNLQHLCQDIQHIDIEMSCELDYIFINS